MMQKSGRPAMYYGYDAGGKIHLSRCGEALTDAVEEILPIPPGYWEKNGEFVCYCDIAKDEAVCYDNLDFTALQAMEREEDRVNALYASGREAGRLTWGPSAWVEYLTTMRVLGDYLRQGMKILDLGAGTGAYTLPLADMGFPVDAVELAQRNAELLRRSVRPGQQIRVFCQSAADLSAFPDGAYDVVLLFGPLYHIADPAERRQCIREALRVCKPEGVLLAAYISNDAVPLTECLYRDFFRPGEPGSYDHSTFRVEPVPFQFLTLEEMRRELRDSGVHILREVASDGVSELLESTINAMGVESYQEYLNYHFYCCEKPEMLGRSNHLLFVGRASEIG